MLNGLNPMSPIPRIYPVGDSAIAVNFGNTIDRLVNDRVIALHQQLLRQPIVFWTDIIPAYASLTLVYDSVSISNRHKESAYQFVKGKIEEALVVMSAPDRSTTRKINVPVCYHLDFAPDSISLCKRAKITLEQLVQLHSSTTYHVYMLGFLPGFAYMGSVDERLAAPRLTKPRTVPAGSVGIAGEQTGIYPLTSPGGWNIIGRTPLVLFDAAREVPTLLQAGDEVIFTPISKEEFSHYVC